MKRFAYLALFLAGLAIPAFAQQEREAAEQALEGLGPVTDSLTMGNMRNAVVPYSGTDVDEADLRPEDFDQAILDVWTGPDHDGRAYQSTLDSVEQRPDVDLGLDPLGLADDAVENAEAALGGLFSADGGTCEAIFQNGNYDGVQLCNAILQREVQICDAWREISVDREDFWACERAERDFTRSCNLDLTWSCTGLRGAECRQDRLKADQPFDWNAASTVMTFNLGGTRPGSGCTMSYETISLESYVGFDPSMFRVLDWRYTGIAQLRVDGETVYTTGTTSRGILHVEFEDAGGKDNITGGLPVLYAGTTRLDYCPFGDGHVQTVGPIDLISRIDWPKAGPTEFRANHRPYVPMGERQTIVIQLIRYYYGEFRPTQLRLEVRGSCCSRITAAGGEQC